MLTTIFIILLIISQLFCFYIIALLNTKVAKFKDLEIRQQQMMREMEESISLYLVEIREENDRLIKELSETKNERKSEKLPVNNIEKEKINVKKDNTDSYSNNNTNEQKIFVPKVVARNAYNKYKNQSDINEPIVSSNHHPNIKQEPEVPPLSFEQQVLKLHNEGKSIEEIAKLTSKGKTEIELLLKFQT